MKKIEAVIPEEKLDAVFYALAELDIGGFTYFNVKGRGQRPREMVSSGRGGRVEATHNVNSFIYVVVKDNMVDKVIDTITSHSSTGKAGEGKIFVYNVDDAVDIGTKKRGESSL
ncbi:MAG: P-II family nitrogen regulator, partial [Thaumarchaeota archaeon]|nr:P-II family nitrogen regulator [Nitrososphaerota archaeon]